MLNIQTCELLENQVDILYSLVLNEELICLVINDHLERAQVKGTSPAVEALFKETGGRHKDLSTVELRVLFSKSYLHLQILVDLGANLVDLTDQLTSVAENDDLNLGEILLDLHQTRHEERTSLSGAINGLKRVVISGVVQYVP